MVIVYTSLGCGPCITTKSWLKERNIAFTEKNVESRGVTEELIALGYRSTPVIVSDKGTVVGYNPKKLSEVLL